MTPNIRKIFLKISNSTILKRTISLKKSIAAYSTSSLIDLLTITVISKIFSDLSKIDNQININIILFTIFFIVAVLLRTFLIFKLRNYSFKKIFERKNRDELKILENFLLNRLYTEENDENSVQALKECIINSTVESARNFDVPIVATIAEMLFAIGGVFFLLHYLGIKVFIFNSPLFLIILVFSKYTAKKLKSLGKDLLFKTENRLLTIDNFTEVSMEVAALKSIDPLLLSFDNSNTPYNKSLNSLFVNTNRLQIVIEAISLVIILLSLIVINLGLTNTSFSDSASSLAILTRMIPSITRSISYLSQLQFGVASIQRVDKLISNPFC